jgi:amidohydrolase
MIREGVLKDPIPDSIIGQHVHPSIPTGKIGIRKGKFMASMDEITMTVHGKGGHAAMPHRNTDPVMITAQILVALQQLVSRCSDPFLPSVLSFGKLVAAGSINIIPDSVYLEGTFRTMDEQWRREAHARIEKIAKGVAESLGGKCDLHIAWGYPVLINEERLTSEVTVIAGEWLGRENVIPAEPWMAAEDFASYSQEISSCFYLLGTGNVEKGSLSSLHSPGFTIDEDALEISTGLMAFIALKQLGNDE